MSNKEIVNINGRPFEVLEWNCAESNCDGEGTYRWELYAIPASASPDSEKEDR